MTFIENINNKSLNVNQRAQNCNTKSILVKIGLIKTGILFISGAVTADYLGVNAIASYVTGATGGILIIGTCLASCIQRLGRGNNDINRSFGWPSSESEKFASQILEFSGAVNGQRSFTSQKSTKDASKLPEYEAEKSKTQIITSETIIKLQRIEDNGGERIDQQSIQLIGFELDVKMNFLAKAGSHTILSPIIETRFHELRAVKDKMHECSILLDLEKAIYQSQMIYLIPLDKKDEADEISKPLFLEYISKYSSQGITEDNIVNWINDETKKDLPFINKTYIYDVVNQWNTWRVVIYVMSRIGKANEKFDRYLPPYVVAYHEVMHAEETPKQAMESYQAEVGGELLTTIKTFILLDLVYKRIYNISEQETIDYGKTIQLRGKSIPLGEFANFYRSLEQKYDALYKALISPESISYLLKNL